MTEAANRRVGVLSTISAPLLPLLLRTLYEHGVDDLTVILDSRGMSAKDLNIFQTRTGGAFDNLGVDNFDFADRGLRFYFVRNHNGEDCLALLRSIEPALLVNGGTPRKLKSPILALPPHGVVNVHPGVLPKYRGSSCVEWAILNDDAVGNSAHFMTEGYDEGPILEVEPYEFDSQVDYVDIRVRVYRESIGLMARTVRRVLDEGLTPEDLEPQGEGCLFPPIGEAEMAEVLARVAENRYRFTGTR